MCHKERQMGTMVEKIQTVTPANFLYDMVKMFANTSHALTPSRLPTPFGARHESTVFCGWVSSTGKEPVHIPNWKGAGPCWKPEKGQSISPTRKGPVHIPNQKGAMQKVWVRAPYRKWPKIMPSVLTLPLYCRLPPTAVFIRRSQPLLVSKIETRIHQDSTDKKHPPPLSLVAAFPSFFLDRTCHYTQAGVFKVVQP